MVVDWADEAVESSVAMMDFFSAAWWVYFEEVVQVAK